MMMTSEDESTLQEDANEALQEAKSDDQRSKPDDGHIFVDDLVASVGGRYQLSALLIIRAKQLISGAPPLIKTDEGDSVITIALKEARANKLEFNPLDLEELKAQKKRARKKT